MSKGLQFVIALGVLAAAVAGSVALVANAPEPQARKSAAEPVAVRTLVVAPRDLDPVVERTGRLQPAQRATLRFEVSGRVTTRSVEPGDMVEAGASLIAVDTADYQARLSAASARLAQELAAIERDRRLLDIAIEQVRLQAAEVERLRALGRDKLVAPSAREDAEQRQLQLDAEVARLRYAVETAAARRTLLEAERDQARRALERARLEAPFAGVVNAVEYEVGDLATTQATAVELVRIDELDAYLELAGADLGAIETGTPMVVAVGERQAEGRVLALAVAPDPRTLTYALRVRVPGAGLRAGELARLRVPLPRVAAEIVVPLEALVTDSTGTAVFVVADNRIERRQVETGRRVGGVQVVDDGLAAGDRIVAANVAALADGQSVRVLE
ncbi:MAG: efflux RND transporter periplasmic adaptor subunit [Chromatiales bacterium]|nr:efflux RND transporter periplasmic adaptor subunit [Chromatiales bacterium]